MKMSRAFWAPADYSEKVVREGVEAEVYLVDSERGPIAYGFGGKRSKPDWNYRFGSEENRAKYVDDYLNRMEERAADKKKRAAEKKNFVHTLEVGSLLYSSWGYDQTNVDFYEVVKLVGKKSVMIAKIGSAYAKEESKSHTYNNVVAVPGSFVEGEEPMLKRVREGNNVSLNSYSNAYPWDGEPKYETAWGYGH